MVGFGGGGTRPVSSGVALPMAIGGALMGGRAEGGALMGSWSASRRQAHVGRRVLAQPLGRLVQVVIESLARPLRLLATHLENIFNVDFVFYILFFLAR